MSEQHQCEILLKRSPIHNAELMGHAQIGQDVWQTLSTGGKQFIDNLEKNTEIYITNPNSKTIKLNNGDNHELIYGDKIIICCVPGLGPLAIIGIVLSVISVVVAFTAFNKLPTIPLPPSTDNEGGSLFTFGGRSNVAEPYSPIAAVYGTIEAPLQFIAQPAGIVLPGASLIYAPSRTFSRSSGATGLGPNSFLFSRSRSFLRRVVTGATIGDEDDDILRYLGTFGPGKIDIDEVQIGDVDARNIASNYYFYNGVDNYRSTIPFYTRISRSENLNTTIDATDNKMFDWVDFKTIENPSQARFDIAFPSGLYNTTDRGNRIHADVMFEWDWRVPGQPWFSESISGDENIFRVGHLSSSPFFRYIRINFPASATASNVALDVRIRRLGKSGTLRGPDQTQLVRFESNKEGEPNKLPRNYSILSGWIKADSRIQGNIPIITAKISKHVIDFSNYDPITGLGAVEKVSSNPAWIYLDALFGVNDENRIQRNQIDWVAFKNWASFCDTEITNTLDSEGNTITEKIASFNGIIDGDVTLEETLRNIASAGYAAPIFKGTLYSIFWEYGERPPVALLTAATTRNFKASKSWPEEIHAYKISYNDENNDYKSNQVIAYLDGYSDDGAGNTKPAKIIKALDVRRLGATTESQAWRYGRYQLSSNLLHQENFTLEINTDALILEVGDIVSLSSDVIGSGSVSGRIERTLQRDLNGSMYTSLDGQTQISNPIISIIIVDQILPGSIIDDLFSSNYPDQSDKKLNIETSESDGIKSITNIYKPSGTLNISGGADISIINWLADELGSPTSTTKLSQIAIMIMNQTGDSNVPAGMNDGLYDGVEYFFGDNLLCLVNNISELRDNVAKIALQPYFPTALVDSWTGQLPVRNVAVDEVPVFENVYAPPRPKIRALYPGEVLSALHDGEQVSHIFVFFEPIEISKLQNHIKEILLQWRVIGDDEWITSVQFSDAQSILKRVPVGADYEMRAAYRDVQDRQSDWTSQTAKNTAALNPIQVQYSNPSPTHISIEGQLSGSTEFYGKSVIINWIDSASVVDAVQNIDGASPIGQGNFDPNFDGYVVNVFGKDSMADEYTGPIREEIVYQKVYQFIGDSQNKFYRFLKFHISRRHAVMGTSDPAVFEISNPIPEPEIGDVSTSVGPGYIEVEIADDVFSQADFKEAIIFHASYNANVPLARGFQKVFKINIDPGDISTYNQNRALFVYFADTFGSSGDKNWNRLAIDYDEIPLPTPVSVDASGTNLVARDASKIPPAPKNVVLNRAVNTIIITFTNPITNMESYPGYNYHKHTEIWRSDENDTDISSAILIGVTSGGIYADGTAAPGYVYNYWIRFISTSNIPGLYNSQIAVHEAVDLITSRQIGSLNADVITSGTVLAQYMDVENFVASNVKVGLELSAPRLVSAENVSGVIKSPEIIGGTILGSNIITETSGLAGLCVPERNDQNQILSAFLDNVDFSSGLKFIDLSGPNVGINSTFTSGINTWDNHFEFDSGHNWILKISDATLNYNNNNIWTSPDLQIPSSAFQDQGQLYRYRWPEINPTFYWDLKTYIPLYNYIHEWPYLLSEYTTDQLPVAHVKVSGKLKIYQGDDLIFLQSFIFGDPADYSIITTEPSSQYPARVLNITDSSRSSRSITMQLRLSQVVTTLEALHDVHTPFPSYWRRFFRSFTIIARPVDYFIFNHKTGFVKMELEIDSISFEQRIKNSAGLYVPHNFTQLSTLGGWILKEDTRIRVVDDAENRERLTSS